MSPFAARSMHVLAIAIAVLAGTACGEAFSKGEEENRVTESIGALAAIEAFIAEQQIDKSKSSWKTTLPKPPQVDFNSKRTFYWELETNLGPIKIRLMPEVAPMHVSSTIYLTRLGFYDGVPFHRVIEGFMAQGGDPLGRGTGGPGYKYDGEFDSSVRHDRPGMLSMANAGPGTDGSQFFLTFVPTPHLDDKHTIFGQVVEGMETVKDLERRGSRSGRPSEPLEIRKAAIAVE
jgi:peptidyl-prolyl cis-trans isomerase B (cyclophilin B)